MNRNLIFCGGTGTWYLDLMETFLQKHKNVLTLTALLVVQTLGLAFQVQKTTPSGTSSNLLHVWAIRLIAPLEKGFLHSQQSVSGVWHNYFYLRGLRSENQDLERQLNELRVQQTRMAEDARQARRIQALLGFKEQFIHKTVAAQVIGTSGSELSRIIYIDRGSNDGIKHDMAVITPTGVVGKVLKADSSTSTVLEITDQTSGVGALLVKSRLQGIVKGTPGGDVILSNIMSDEKVDVGDLVTTSGGDRVFPKGLAIGTVSAVFPGKDVFLNIRLKPAADLNRLEEVLVITEVSTQAPDTTDMGPIRAADILASRLPSVPQTAPAEGQKPGEQKPGEAKPGEEKPGTAKPPTAPATSEAAKQGTAVKRQTAPANSTTAAPKKSEPPAATAKPKTPAPKPQTPETSPQEPRP